MKKYLQLIVAFFLILNVSTIFSQDLSVFGFIQANANYISSSYEVPDVTMVPFGETMVPAVKGFKEVDETKSTFYLQQLNVFFNNNFNDKFNAFVNIEMTNNYSSENFFGTMNLQEAFLNYSHSDMFNVKAGLFLPKFGYLYEFQNRFPILPYIIRPLIYETAFYGILGPQTFLPSRGNLQIYGYLLNKNFKVDYSVFAGNSTRDYITNSNPNGNNNQDFFGINPTGWDASNFKTFGGRIGFKNANSLRLGFSAATDRHNLKEVTILDGLPTIDLGDAPRIKAGADFGLKIGA